MSQHLPGENKIEEIASMMYFDRVNVIDVQSKQVKANESKTIAPFGLTLNKDDHDLCVSVNTAMDNNLVWFAGLMCRLLMCQDLGPIKQKLRLGMSRKLRYWVLLISHYVGKIQWLFYFAS